MPIDAREFAQLVNDFALPGTYGLQGTSFSPVIKIFDDYVDALTRSGQVVPAHYRKLFDKFGHILAIHTRLENSGSYDPHLLAVTTEIILDLDNLPDGDSLFLPGGWLNSTNGHALIYQFTRHDQDYHFSVINTGEGLQYHAKQSLREKELYYSVKMWRIPAIENDAQRKELTHFVTRLLRVCCIQHPLLRMKPWSADLVYQEILSSISHCNGKALDVRQHAPAHARTAGQFSGTCIASVLLETLKINAPSLEDYQRFILPFKVYVTLGFAEPLLARGTIRQSVKEQILLGIDNNIRIASLPALCDLQETQLCLQQLNSLKNRVLSTYPKIKPPPQHRPQRILELLVYGKPFRIKNSNAIDTEPFPQASWQMLKPDSRHLLDSMEAFNRLIVQVPDVCQYYQIEQFILALPIAHEAWRSQHGFYSALTTETSLQTFLTQLSLLQNQLGNIRYTLLKQALTPALSVLTLNILYLQTEAYERLLIEQKLPYFRLFSNWMMHTLLGNQTRNPFLATNHAPLDARLQEMLDYRHVHQKPSCEDYYTFFLKTLKTEPDLYDELMTHYAEQYAGDVSRLHQEIRDKGLQVLYLLSHNRPPLASKFNPLITKLDRHLAFESSLRQAVNVFFTLKLSADIRMTFQFDEDDCLVMATPLYAFHLPFQKLENHLSRYKYQLTPGTALLALTQDTLDRGPAVASIPTPDSNTIQLMKPRQKLVTEVDLIDRMYFHLRLHPTLQIPMTLDYFTTHLEQLADSNCQRYLEANLFQPQALLHSSAKAFFLPQCDRFLAQGLIYYNKSGLFTTNSLFFLRLNFLISRYLCQRRRSDSMARLADLQQTIENQLSQARDPDLIYLLQQYLFLNISTRCELGDAIEPLLAQGCSALLYINTHTNPLIMEDCAHHMDVQRAKAVFLIKASQAPEALLLEQVTVLFWQYFPDLPSDAAVTGTFPIYTCMPVGHRLHLDKGKMFVNGLSQCGLPLHIRHHRLIQHLGLQAVSTCLTNENETRFSMKDGDTEVIIHQSPHTLFVEKSWHIDGETRLYQLQPLSKQHLAFRDNPYAVVVPHALPAMLKDIRMDFWTLPYPDKRGILTQNNQARYASEGARIMLLDEQGRTTDQQLTALTAWQHRLLSRFEHQTFILHIQSPTGSLLKLDRYQLVFEQGPHSEQDPLFLLNSDEQVADIPSPIGAGIAGLVLSRQAYCRYLVPVQRVHLTSWRTLKTCDRYAFKHDIQHRIPPAQLTWYAPDNIDQSMWCYEGSEEYVSFQLQNNEPIANTAADALYLAYLYLASSQNGKAWETLDRCYSQQGGLTGDPKELQYISWIVDCLPFMFDGELEGLKRQGLDEPQRKTADCVANQLKALALLCDYLNQGYNIAITEQAAQGDSNNQRYALLTAQRLKQFLNELASTIQTLFSRMQALRRHTPCHFLLSKQACLSLLQYYHAQCPKHQMLKGALGAEWIQLSFETLIEERLLLLSGQAPSAAQASRLNVIQQRINDLPPVLAHSTHMQLFAIDMTLPQSQYINSSYLTRSTCMSMASWIEALPAGSRTESELKDVLDELDSEICDNQFILLFPALFQLACPAQQTAGSSTMGLTSCQEKLCDFCIKTLITHRHTPLEKQDSNIPFLCNLLYRILENQDYFAQYKTASLKQFVEEASRLYVSDIFVYQASDCYQEPLLSTQILANETTMATQHPLRLPPQAEISVLQETGIDKLLSLEHSAELHAILNAFESAHKASEQQLSALAATLDGSLNTLLAVEREAGKYLLAWDNKQRELAHQLRQHSDLFAALRQAAGQSLITVNEHIQQAWHDALSLANQGPDDPRQAQGWQLQRQSSARALLTQKDLLKLYCRADAALSIELTGLNLDQAFRLHQLIHQALVSGLRKQILELTATNPGEDSLQVLDLLARNKLPGLDEPSMLIIQHEDKKILRRYQISALTDLLQTHDGPHRFNECVVTVKPGGGKSKVFLPVLAETNATGDNLLIIEVPPGLLATNHVDLNQTSQRLFGKRAWRFEFNRASDCSPDALKRIYQHFTGIMTRREYLVTTVESMQSLDLKYKELLLQPLRHNEVWKQQIYWCDKLDHLFNQHTDLVIDESHQGLSLNKKLNYPFGQAKALESEIINAATLLFSYIDVQLIRTAPLFSEAYDWLPFRLDLAHKLVNRPDSPIALFIRDAVTRHGEAVRSTLVDYLSEQSKTDCEAVHKATQHERKLLGFLKGEINKQLPFSLLRQLNKDYGASARAGLTAAERTMAIPYMAANVPNERTRIGIDLQAINQCSQKMLIEGISRELFGERILEWQMTARQELFEMNGAIHLSDTPTAGKLRRLTGNPDFHLHNIDVNDKEQIDRLHARYRLEPAIILDCLRDIALKQITQDSAMLVSNNFNHIDQVRSVRTISGTPSKNLAAHHLRLHYNPANSLGTDDYIFELLLQKKTPVLCADFDELAPYLTRVFMQSASLENTRLLTDINGTFTGVSNHQIASAIAAFIRANPQRFNTVIKQVLYFDDQHLLCALEAMNPDKITRIGSSDEDVIRRILMLEPCQRFTVLDPLHSTGADIQQDPRAHAIVLTDEKSGSANFAQGVSRLRSIAGEQSLELVVPSRLQGISIEQLREHYQNNDIRSIQAESPGAIHSQLHTVIRHDLWTYIRLIPSENAELKSALARHFYAVLVQQASTDYFSRYGGINQKQQTEHVLNHYQQTLKAQWTSCLAAARLSAKQQEIDQIDGRFLRIKERGRHFCANEYEHQDPAQALEVEQQTDVHQDLELDMNRLNECYDPTRKPAPFKVPDQNFTPFPQKGLSNGDLFHVNDICQPLSLSLFSSNLLTTRNFGHTWHEQRKMPDAFIKPVLLIWYVHTRYALYATLLTPDEAVEMEIRGYFRAGSWLSSTQDTLISGTMDNELLNNVDYQSLREQIRFFNGELRSLLQQDSSLHWIKNNQAEKLDFFEASLLRYRPGCALELRQLRAMLNRDRQEEFDYVANHYFTDLSRLNWTERFPHASASQIYEYQQLAQAFQEAIDNKYISSGDLSLRYNLSKTGRERLQSHIELLHKLAGVTQKIRQITEDQPFLALLNSTETIQLTRILDIPLPQDKGQQSSMSVLATLRAHPAMKGKTLITEWFNKAAANFSSPIHLRYLMEHIGNIPQLLNSLMANPALPDTFLPDLHQLEIRQCTNARWLWITIVDGLPSQGSIQALMTHPHVSDRALCAMLDTCKQDEQLQYFATQASQNGFLSPWTLESLDSNDAWPPGKASNPGLIIKLRDRLNRPFDNNALLEFLMKNQTIRKHVLRTLLDRPQLDVRLLEYLVETQQHKVEHINRLFLEVCDRYSKTGHAVWSDFIAESPLDNESIISNNTIHSIVVNDNLASDPRILGKIIQRQQLDKWITNALARCDGLASALSALPCSEAVDAFIQHLIGSSLISKCFIEQITSTHPSLLSPDMSIQLMNNLFAQARINQEKLICLYRSPAFRPLFSGRSDIVVIMLDCASDDELVSLLPCVDIACCLEFLCTRDRKMLMKLDLSPLMSRATAQQLIALARLYIYLDVSKMDQFIAAVSDNEAIHFLLNRPNMTAERAQVLFSKAQFDFHVKDDWEWLNPDLRMAPITYPNSDNFDLVLAILHTQDEATRRACFDVMANKQQAYRLPRTRDAKLKSALYDLRVNACDMTLQALKGDIQCEQLARASFELHRELRMAIATHAGDPARLREVCLNAIADKRDILAQSRGLTHTVRDIFAWRFFKTPAASGDLVNRFVSILDEGQAESRMGFGASSDAVPRANCH